MLEQHPTRGAFKSAVFQESVLNGGKSNENNNNTRGTSKGEEDVENEDEGDASVPTTIFNCLFPPTSDSFYSGAQQLSRRRMLPCKYTHCVLSYHVLDVPLSEYERFFHPVVRYLTWCLQSLGTFELSIPGKTSPMETMLCEMRRLLMLRKPERPRTLWETIEMDEQEKQSRWVSQEDSVDYAKWPMRCVVVFQGYSDLYPTMTIIPVESGLKWDVLVNMRSEIRVEVCFCGSVRESLYCMLYL
jgi:hypothetical protein